MVLALVALLLVPPAVADEGLFGSTYPVETSVAFHGALLHWMDSIGSLGGAGLTSGKTATIHRQEFLDAHGEPSKADLMMLRLYRRVRLQWIERAPAARRDDLTLAFFESEDLDGALERAVALLGEKDAADLERSMRHFAARYAPIWNDGRIVRAFLARCDESKLRGALGGFLAGVAAFFGVPAAHDPPPRLVLVPVRSGSGTHAQAIGRFLLLEIRPNDDLVNEVSPIVHENTHFLFLRMGAERLKAFERQALARGATGRRAWKLLHEALPTAIGQGVADARFRPGWSTGRRWYHHADVDRYAKRIEPIVRRALSDGGRFDAELLERLLTEGGATPPSP